jgi:hypothetical protein
MQGGIVVLRQSLGGRVTRQVFSAVAFRLVHPCEEIL